MNGSTVVVENARAVEYFELDLSAGPGVYELRGTRGLGKSTVLDAIDFLAGRRVTMTVTDGKQAGSVRGFGVVAPIGARKRRRGDLEISALDAEKFSLDDIVSPAIKDPVAADALRIKALVSLRRVEAEPADYYELFGGRMRLEALIAPDKLATDDPVLLASRIKDAVEAQARQSQARSANERQHAEGYRLQAEGADLSQASDPAELRAALTGALNAENALRAKRARHMAEETARVAAVESLRVERAEYAGPSAARATEKAEATRAEITAASDRISELREALRAEEAQLKLLESELRGDEQAEKTAKAHERLCAQWEAMAAAPVTPDVADGELSGAAAAVEAAQLAMEGAVRVRDALAALESARKHKRDAEAAETEVERYRALAAGVFDVLSRLVKCPDISIESVNGFPRCVVRHKRRGRTLYCELSDGERVISALNAILDCLGTPALLPVGQRLWQDLPPADRDRLDTYAATHEVYLIGAQVTDDETLCVRRYRAQEA